MVIWAERVVVRRRKGRGVSIFMQDRNERVIFEMMGL
jgi:hypothetical protein